MPAESSCVSSCPN